MRRALALAVILFWGLVPARASAVGETNSAVLFQELTTLDPYSETNLVKLAALAERAAVIEKNESKAEKKAARDAEDLKNLPTAELQKIFADDSAKHDSRGFSAIGRSVKK